MTDPAISRREALAALAGLAVAPAIVGGAGAAAGEPEAFSRVTVGGTATIKPSPGDLYEPHRRLAHTCAQLNAMAVSRQPLRLYLTTKSGQIGPSEHFQPQPATASTERRLREDWATRGATADAERIDELTVHPLLFGNPCVDLREFVYRTCLALDHVGWMQWRYCAYPWASWYLLPMTFDPPQIADDRVTFGFPSLHEPTWPGGESPTRAFLRASGLSDDASRLEAYRLFTILGAEPVDRDDTLAVDQLTLAHASRVFGIPIKMLQSADLTRDQVDAAHHQHAAYTVWPRCQMIAGALTNWTHGQAARHGDSWGRLVWVFDDPRETFA